MRITLKSASGFTLIELIIAIALSFVLATIAIPSFIGQRNFAKLKDAASMIRVDLAVARSWAIRENSFATVLISADSYIMFIDNGVGGGIAENWVQDGNERILSNRRLPEGTLIDLTQTTLDTQRTRFNGRGYILNTGKITLSTASGKSTTIDMGNRFGRISTY